MTSQLSAASQLLQPWERHSHLEMNRRPFTLESGQRVEPMPFVGAVILTSDPRSSFLVLLSELEMQLNAVVLGDINFRRPRWRHNSLG